MMQPSKLLLVLAVSLSYFSASSSLAATTTNDKILFVCGGNTGRSPMAEYLANDYFHFAKDGYIADSRGANVNPKELTPESYAIVAMKELGVKDISAHRATPVTKADINSAKLVLVMTEAHKEKLLKIDPTAKNIYLLAECATGKKEDIADAYGHDLRFYENTRDTIAKYIELIQKNHMQCVSNKIK